MRYFEPLFNDDSRDESRQPLKFGSRRFLKRCCNPRNRRCPFCDKLISQVAYLVHCEEYGKSTEMMLRQWNDKRVIILCCKCKKEMELEEAE
jgi:hypothetical protein